MNLLPVLVSIKGSCAVIAAYPLKEEPHTNDMNYHGLYIEDEYCTRLVALAKIYEGSLIVHHVSLTNDGVKVGVSKVLDEDASALFPTLEIQFVRHVRNTFFA